MPTFLNVTPEDLKFLLAEGFGTEQTKSEYEAVRYKGYCTVILYKSGKAVVSGKDEQTQKLCAKLMEKGCEMVDRITFVPQEGWMIGSDESLKGDTFGGLVVAAVRADDAGRNVLRLIGVEDSKKLDDTGIAEMASQIKSKVKYSVKSVDPSEYNKHSQTELMNQLHKAVATDLGSGVHVVDKYPGCNVGDIRETKAESKYLEVAAASILARDEGLKQFEKLSKEIGMNLPMGSTHVAEALNHLMMSKKDPSLFVKMHFKNVQAALEIEKGIEKEQKE